jgi:hypothetical protein
MLFASLFTTAASVHAVPLPVPGAPCEQNLGDTGSHGLVCASSPLDSNVKLWLPVWGGTCKKRGQKFWNLQCDYIFATRSREAAGTMQWDVVSIPRIGKVPKGTPEEIAQQFASDVGVIWNLSNGKSFSLGRAGYVGGCASWACSGYHPRIYTFVWRKYAKAKVTIRADVPPGGAIRDKVGPSVPNFATCYSLKIAGQWHRAVLDYGQYDKGGEAYASVRGAC